MTDDGGPVPGAASPGGADDDGPLWLHAVVRQPLAGRARGWLRSGRRARAGDDGEGQGALAGLDGIRRIGHEGLAAVVSSAGGGAAEADADARLDHHARVVEALAGSGTVVPAPPGLRAPGEAAVRAFLDRARVSLEEALDRFHGACEMRLHVRRREPAAGDAAVAAKLEGAVAAKLGGAASGTADDGVADGSRRAAAAEAADGLYHRLRRHARAARRLSPVGDDLLTAAFLAPRGGWSEGADLAARWQERQPGLVAELSGPWAPYDFVRMFPVEAP